MPSVTSYFNKTLFLKNVKRFWPLWAVYLAGWTLAIPGFTFALRSLSLQNVWRQVHCDSLGLLNTLGVWAALFMGVLTAMAVFSYLFFPRSANLMHTLPIRREGLFLTSYCSGVAFFLVPNALIVPLTLLAELFCPYMSVSTILLWFALESLMCLFFYSLAVFCAVLTGHLLAMPAFFAAFNGLAAMIYALVDALLQLFLFGYSGGDGAARLTEILTPVWCLSDSLCAYTTDLYGQSDTLVGSTVVVEGIPTVIAFGAAGLVLAGAALLIYRLHRVESAGDVVSVAAVRPVFKYVVAFLGALSLGQFLYEIFWENATVENAWAMTAFLALSGVICYFAAEMLLKKTFRVFNKKAWTGLACFLIALVPLCACMELDIFGYEDYVPDVSQVESVYVAGLYSAPYDSAEGMHENIDDPARIAQVLELHRLIAGQKDEIESRATYERQTYESGEYESISYTSVELTYTLKSGATMTRTYRFVPILSAELGDEGTVSGIADALINEPGAVAASYGLEVFQHATPSYLHIPVYDLDDQCFIDEEITDAALLQEVEDALLQDFAEGNLGRRYLVEDETRCDNTCFNDMNLELRMDEADSLGDTYTSLIITMTPQAAHTIAALTAAGVLDEGHVLRTMTQWYSD